MSKMSISTYGSVNKEAGWNSQEVKAEKEKITIEDVLRSAELKDGRTLFDLIAEGNRIKENYAQVTNSQDVQSKKIVDIPLRSGLSSI